LVIVQVILTVVGLSSALASGLRRLAIAAAGVTTQLATTPCRSWNASLFTATVASASSFAFAAVPQNPLAVHIVVLALSIHDTHKSIFSLREDWLLGKHDKSFGKPQQYILECQLEHDQQHS
jgi:hypothetical protein